MTAAAGGALGRMRRQWRHLFRHSAGRLADAAVASRSIGAEQAVLWGAALLTVPQCYAAVIWPSRYPWLRRLSLQQLQVAVLEDRLFFVLWPMVVALLAGVLMWEGLMPDRTDQRILGVLPVGTRTVAAARLTTALVAIVVLVLGTSLPAAIIYALGSVVHPSIGGPLGSLAGQLLAALLAGLAAFAALLVVRGVAALVVDGGGRGFAVLLQIAAVVATVQTFLFLPGIQRALRVVLLAPDVRPASVPVPAWFIGVFVGLAGGEPTPITTLAWPALALTVGLLLAAIVIHLLPARWHARRALEARSVATTASAAARVAPLAGRFLRRPRDRARVGFVLLTLIRGRRQLLIVATYVGLGIAVAATRLISASVRHRLPDVSEPSHYFLSVPLVLVFCLLVGLRAAFAVPSEPTANWTFRIMGPRSALDSRGAVRHAYWCLGVLPVTFGTGVFAVWAWPLDIAWRATALVWAASAVACEAALWRHDGVPFTRARSLSQEALRVRAVVGVMALYGFGFVVSRVFAWAVSEDARVWTLAAVAAATALGVAIAGRRGMAGLPATFEAAMPDTATTLSLSEAARS